jgi:hypothetical protein
MQRFHFATNIHEAYQRAAQYLPNGINKIEGARKDTAGMGCHVGIGDFGGSPRIRMAEPSIAVAVVNDCKHPALKLYPCPTILTTPYPRLVSPSSTSYPRILISISLNPFY